MQNITYFISIIDRDNLDKVHSQLQLPFLPRVGDDILVENTGFQILKVNIQADQIMVRKPESKILTMDKQPMTDEENVIIPAILIAVVHNIEEEEDNSNG